MKTPTLLLGLVVVAAAFAGCANEGTTPTPTTTTGTTTPTPTTTTPTATTTTPTIPTTVTPVVPTPVNNTTSNATSVIRAVHLTSVEDWVDTGDAALVCWRVEGSGKIPHTAVHYDNASHDTSLFSDYKLGAMYPENRTTPDPAGYALPGTFCTNVPTDAVTSGAGNDTASAVVIFLRAHALAPPALPGNLSSERAIEVGARTLVHFVTEIPEEMAGGENFTACWRVPSSVTGNATSVPHTAIHYDNVTHPGLSAAFSAYAGGAVYPGNATSQQGPYNLTETFCANVPVPESGTIYFRAHVLDPATGVDETSVERAIRGRSA